MSQIKVDTITDELGTGSPSFPNGVDAADLTGTLPALDASALTDLDASELTGALPAIDGSALTGIASGPTLVATISTSGSREITVSSLDLSSYSLLYFFGYNLIGGSNNDYVHIRDSGDSTNGYNRIGSMQIASSSERGYFGGVIDLNTGMGFSSSTVMNSVTALQNTAGVTASALDTGITTSSTSVVIGHSEGGGQNWYAGTVKLYGA